MEVRSFDAVKAENFYLQRFGLGSNRIKSFPDKGLNLIVTIPALNEPDLTKAVKSILDCTPPKSGVEVIVLINHSENASPEIVYQNQESYNQLKDFLKNENRPFPVHILTAFDLPKKHAGVGLARKILMDEAVYRFEAIQNKSGIIICFDGDSTVSKNYLIEIEKYFHQNPPIKAAGINFEHPFKELLENSQQRCAIVEYELHLRYYIDALRWSGHPFSYQTIGSSMMVRSEAYQACGGMNKRKAGEDFYFLQKIIPNGGFGQINSAMVFPSCRASNRVPFGTGKAVGDFLNESTTTFNTYNFEIFEYLKPFWFAVNSFYEFSIDDFKEELNHQFSLIASYLSHSNQWSMFDEVKRNSPSLKTFRKRFFNWINAFQALKIIHYLEHIFPKQAVVYQANLLGKQLGISAKDNAEDLLEEFRNWDKKNPPKLL